MSDAAHDLHPQAKRVVDWASERGVTIAVREYPDEGARTAQDAANAVGCTVDQIVKSMIFAVERPAADTDVAADTGNTELVLALTAGSNQIDPEALANVAGAPRCGRADPAAVREVTGYAIGGVPPFGHQHQLRTWVDPHLLTFDEVWGAAGTPRHVFPIAPADLVRLTGGVEASFTRA